MRLTQKNLIAIAVLSVCTIAPTLLVAGAASAKPITFDGSYIGAGVAAGVTSSGLPGGEADFGGNIQGRLAIPNAPISLRGAVLFGGDNTAVMPILSYDQPISSNTNIYAGAGYSFVDKAGKPSPLGNRDAVVLTAGVESGLSRNVVVYGDAKWGIDAFQNSSGDALSLQAGVGYRF